MLTLGSLYNMFDRSAAVRAAIIKLLKEQGISFDEILTVWIQNPKFDEVKKGTVEASTDWRGHVDEELIKVWDMMTTTDRLLIFYYASQKADSCQPWNQEEYD